MVNDLITSVKVSLVILPLQKPASDAKVLTGKQKPLSEVAFLFAEIQSEEGHEGVGYSYALRAGAPALYAHARELAPALIGENPNDIQRIWSKLAWLGQSVGRSGVTAQAVAAFDVALWDLKAKRARLPLAQLLGAHRDSVPCYNTSGGYLSTPIDELITDAQASLEEPLDAYDADGHAELARQLATPIATGEMLTSTADHYELIRRGAVDFIQPDAPRVGGITPFLKIMALGEQAKMDMAPHFAMEIHDHLSAAYELDTWVEHFDWLKALFDERVEIRGGHMHVPSRHALGLSISEQARSWTVTTDTFTDSHRLTLQLNNA